MSVKIFALGPLDDWNALSPGEQAVFEAHYLTIANASSAYPSIPTDKHIFRFIGVLEGDAFITYLPDDTNGHRLVIDGNGFYYNSNYSGNDLKVNNVTASVLIDFENIVIQFNTMKSQPYNGFLEVTSCENVDLNFSNNVLIGNGNKGCAIKWFDSNNGSVLAERNIIYGAGRGLYVQSGTTITVDFNKNTIYNCDEYAMRTLVGTRTLYKNACFDSGTKDYDGAYSGTYNASSDLTGNVDYRSMTAVSALVDPVGDDFTPIKNGPLKINKRTYIGAIQLRANRLMNKLKKLIMWEE